MITSQYRMVIAAALMGALPLAAQEAATPAKTTTTEEVVLLDKYEVKELKSFSDQAIAGTTPVAFTELSKTVIEEELASRDIPLVLNTTPSVFATTDGGGAGDARVNVRGFSQRNVSILINGVPTNDIENGWLYWSNWDGLGDVTSTIQMQRGLSNVTLPTPSIGGTMNIVTDVAASQLGGSVKLEAGSNDFKKVTGVFNTGLIDGKVAFTFGYVAKKGDGYVDGTWTEGQGYYLGSTWLVNKKNRLEMFVIGSPQKHGQRTFASNIAAYDVDYARKLGYTEEQIYNTSYGAIKSGPIDQGRTFNPNYAPVSASYTGMQYYWGRLQERQNPNFLNERENYFHKPQVNINWYSTLSDRLKLATVVYYSGGRGGGSGTINTGSSSAAFARYANNAPLYGSAINWDATIASNAGSTNAAGGTKIAGQSLGILRNSVNNQDQFGLISKLSFEISENLTWVNGVDLRTAKIDHYREVRDLLGGDYYIPTYTQGSDFWNDRTKTLTTRKLGLGDKLDYDTTNTVDWLGLFSQAQYTRNALTAFGIVGYSSIDYSFTDHFRRSLTNSNEEYKLNAPSRDGYQFKGGVNYQLTKTLSAYANAGYVIKAPIFDGVINDTIGTFANSSDEKFTSYESGLRFETPGKSFNVSVGGYYTQWRDRTNTRASEGTAEPFESRIFYVRDIDTNHAGVEIESAYKPLSWLRFDAAVSLAKWEVQNDPLVETYTFNSDGSLKSTTSKVAYLKDLMVGDAPQTQVAYSATVFPVRGLSIKLQGLWYDRYWSEYDLEGRTNSADRAQSWKIPSYDIYNLHINYRLPIGEKVQVSLFAHMTNIFDTVYVSDATDESSFESVYTQLAARHSAQRAEVFLGAARTVNLGVKVAF